MNNVSEILHQWEIIYDVLKNKWKDGKHFADPEHMRNGFIALYEHVAQLESTITEVTKLAKEPIVNIANSEHDDALLRLVRIIEVLEGE